MAKKKVKKKVIKKKTKKTARKTAAKKTTTKKKPATRKTAAKKAKTTKKKVGRTVKKAAKAVRNFVQESVTTEFSEYHLVIEDSTRSLEDAVNYRLKKGWVPLGGVVVREDGRMLQTLALKS